MTRAIFSRESTCVSVPVTDTIGERNTMIILAYIVWELVGLAVYIGIRNHLAAGR